MIPLCTNSKSLLSYVVSQFQKPSVVAQLMLLLGFSTSILNNIYNRVIHSAHRTSVCWPLKLVCSVFRMWYSNDESVRWRSWRKLNNATSDVTIFGSRIVDRDPAPGSSRIADRDTTAIKTNDIVDCNFLVMAHKNTCGIHVRSHVNTFRPGLRCQHCALVTFAHPFSRPLTQKGFSISPLPAHLHRPDGNIRDIILYIYIYIYILRLSLWQPDPLRKDTVRLTSLFLKDYRTLLIFNETI